VSPRLALAVLLLAGSAAAAQTPATRPGVPPQGMSCPVSHPIKGNFTTYSGERCIHHMPGGAFYGKTRPERCYVSESDAVLDGCRRSKR
jgi:hypothetical protein